MAEYIERDAFIAWLKRIPLKDLSDGRGLCRIIMEEDFKRAIRELPREVIADVAPVGWISVKDKLPEPETEVLAVCVRNGYRFICPVIFEDGTMLTQNSMWNWYELGNYGTYSEENDDYFIPEGWWENRQFTPDDIYNNPVDCTVTHWMPLPEPPMSARMDGGADNETD